MTAVKLCNRFLVLLGHGKEARVIAAALKIPDWKRYEIIGALKAAGRLSAEKENGQTVYKVLKAGPLNDTTYRQALKEYKHPKKKRTAGKANEKLLDKPIELNAAVPSSTGTITLTIAQLAELINRLRQ